MVNNDFKKFFFANKMNNIRERLLQSTRGSNESHTEEYAGHPFLQLDEANRKIAEYIQSDSPFMVARYGGTEMNMICAYFERKFFYRYGKYRDAVRLLCDLSGFFPEDKKLAGQFTEYMLEISSTIDLLGAWGKSLFMEDFVCEKYAVNAELTKLRNLEPYYAADGVIPWSQALKGKRVLVIHPFEDSIRRQYENRQRIWKDLDILPEFELDTVKAVQTLADQRDDRFDNWFDALHYMLEECRKREFDIALVGCGAYGMPLAAEIKRMGKGAIHLGGALQILFGIKGNRWDDHPIISGFYNDAWIRPIEKLPKGGDRVENACYW